LDFNGVCVLPNAIAGGAHDYFGYIIATNQEPSGTDAFTLVSGSLPPGLSMPSNYGTTDTVINGVPSQPGTLKFVVKTADPDEGLSSLQSYSITVTLPPPDTLVCSPDTNGGTLVNGDCVLPGANIGQGYEGFILTSNNSGGTFSISSGSLPPGMSMPSSYGASGTIVAGTPTQQGTFTFTVKGTDQEGQPLQQTYSIQVGPPLPLSITDPNPCCPAGTVDTPYDQNLFASGGVQPYTWSIASGQLPPGLSLDCPAPPVSFDGVPTTAGTFTFTLRVTDSRGTQTTEQSSITIQPSSSPSASLSVSPTCVHGGSSATGTVRLGIPAPAGGAVVGLMVNGPAVAAVPSSVTVPAGATSANFPVGTKPVSSNTNVTLIDSYGGQNQFASLSVRTS
jgi:Putative Ig domain